MTPSALMVIDLVIVTEPNLPESSALISPPAAVLLIAPAKVLHGAVREQGLASSPTPETQVREACAIAGEACNINMAASATRILDQYLSIVASIVVPLDSAKSTICLSNE